MGQIAVVEDENVRKRIDRSSQIGEGSAEAVEDFIVRDVMIALRDSQGHSSTTFFGSIDADEDESDGKSDRCDSSQPAYLRTNRIR